MQKPKQGTQNKETPYSKEQETQHDTQKPANKKLRQVNIRNANFTEGKLGDCR